ncbi:hypothetical protein KBZ15_15515 [Cyanobium sp. BA20m-p-22]|nr:hypothetical protein [Cyanobium sp. BA20m-p-22]MCP9911302.1 hypothetical protein [Cyanobium sp. BA20m-p-22]
MNSDIRWQQRFSNYSQGDAIATNISGRNLPCFQQLKIRLELRLQEEAQ